MKELIHRIEAETKVEAKVEAATVEAARVEDEMKEFESWKAARVEAAKIQAAKVEAERVEADKYSIEEERGQTFFVGGKKYRTDAKIDANVNKEYADPFEKLDALRKMVE